MNGTGLTTRAKAELGAPLVNRAGIRSRVRCVCVPAVKGRDDGTVGDRVVQALVSLSTEALRLFGPKAPLSELPVSSHVSAPSSMAEFVAKLEEDFQRGYFVTGDLADELYVSDCVFADPTISFEGLELYKSNLQLLIPFLRAPEIRLKRAIEVVDEEAGSGQATVRAYWTLDTGLKLPWKPRVFVNGTTDYSLVGLRIVRHVERWDIDPREAVLMVLGLYSGSYRAQ
jgi:hypothetical protein